METVKTFSIYTKIKNTTQNSKLMHLFSIGIEVDGRVTLELTQTFMHKVTINLRQVSLFRSHVSPP